MGNIIVALFSECYRHENKQTSDSNVKINRSDDLVMDYELEFPKMETDSLSENMDYDDEIESMDFLFTDIGIY